jgi:hypothetical protein
MSASAVEVVRKRQLVLGAVQMLVCCLWGFLGDGMLDKKAFSGAHHQFAHNGELQLVLALAVPFLGVSDFWLGVFEVALTIGTWGNPLAYAIVAVSGEGNALFVAAKEGPWGKLAEVLLMFVTAPAILTTLVIAIVGFARGNGNGNGNALSNAKKSK